jgi:hypothetical protein
MVGLESECATPVWVAGAGVFTPQEGLWEPVDPNYHNCPAQACDGGDRPWCRTAPGCEHEVGYCANKDQIFSTLFPTEHPVELAANDRTFAWTRDGRDTWCTDIVDMPTAMDGLGTCGTCNGGDAPTSTTRAACEGAGTCTATADGATTVGLESECAGVGTWAAGAGVFTEHTGTCVGGDAPTSTTRAACEGAGTCTATADDATTVGLESECAGVGTWAAGAGVFTEYTAKAECEASNDSTGAFAPQQCTYKAPVPCECLELRIFADYNPGHMYWSFDDAEKQRGPLKRCMESKNMTRPENPSSCDVGFTHRIDWRKSGKHELKLEDAVGNGWDTGYWELFSVHTDGTDQHFAGGPINGAVKGFGDSYAFFCGESVGVCSRPSDKMKNQACKSRHHCTSQRKTQCRATTANRIARGGSVQGQPVQSKWTHNVLTQQGRLSRQRAHT